MSSATYDSITERPLSRGAPWCIDRNGHGASKNCFPALKNSGSAGIISQILILIAESQKSWQRVAESKYQGVAAGIKKTMLQGSRESWHCKRGPGNIGSGSGISKNSGLVSSLSKHPGIACGASKYQGVARGRRADWEAAHIWRRRRFGDGADFGLAQIWRWRRF
jgi:hypothetical protein